VGRIFVRGSEFYCAAASRDQAALVFNTAYNDSGRLTRSYSAFFV